MLKRRHTEDRSSTARGLIPVVAALALLAGVVGVAHASPPTAASGTGGQTAITAFEIDFAGKNVIIEQSSVGFFSGALTGTTEDSFRVVIHPNGKFNAHGEATCQCTVDGRSGVVEFALTNTGEEIDGVPTFQGRFIVTGASGDLAGLRGVLEFEGTVNPETGLSTSTYSGSIHMHP